MPARLLGAHMPTSGGLHNAVANGKAIGCTAVQVFTSSPQQWAAKPITPDMVAQFQAAKESTGIDVVVSHDSYLINLCAPDEAKREQSIGGLKAEIERCAAYGIHWTVSHVGAHMGQGEEEGLRIAAESMRKVLAESSSTVTVLAETTAGQGSSLDYRFEQLARLIDGVGGDARLGVCLDTCHIFVAGYDIRDDQSYDETFEAFGRIVGFERLKAIHCNDSKNPLGKRVDRHEHLGQGFIGAHAFQRLVNDPRFENIPILLETPEAETMHAANLKKLLDWRVG